MITRTGGSGVVVVSPSPPPPPPPPSPQCSVHLWNSLTDFCQKKTNNNNNNKSLRCTHEENGRRARRDRGQCSTPKLVNTETAPRSRGQSWLHLGKKKYPVEMNVWVFPSLHTISATWNSTLLFGVVHVWVSYCPLGWQKVFSPSVRTAPQSVGRHSQGAAGYTICKYSWYRRQANRCDEISRASPRAGAASSLWWIFFWFGAEASVDVYRSVWLKRLWRPSPWIALSPDWPRISEKQTNLFPPPPPTLLSPFPLTTHISTTTLLLLHPPPSPLLSP